MVPDISWIVIESQCEKHNTNTSQTHFGRTMLLKDLSIAFTWFGSIKKVMILSKKVMILSGSILVIWFEILLILHGKVIIRLKIRYTDKGRVDRGSPSVVFWMKLVWISHIPCWVLIAWLKKTLSGCSLRNFRTLIRNASQWNSCKRLLLKRASKRFLDQSKWKKEENRNTSSFPLQWNLKNHVELKNHMFYSLQISWSK